MAGAGGGEVQQGVGGEQQGHRGRGPCGGPAALAQRGVQPEQGGEFEQVEDDPDRLAGGHE
ncbi:hypothetical protein ACWC5I_15795, partial [Kitasatospora sp. NPDC001574]